MTTRLHERYPTPADIEDFERLLSDAASQAKSEWEQEFVSDLNERYELYGSSLYISEKQIEQLERIVG